MRSTAALRMIRPTARMMMRPSPSMFVRPTARRLAVPKEDQAGHTISQRLRKLKDIPVELLPLAFVVGLACFAAGYALIRKLTVDKTIRLYRQGPAARAEHSAEHSDEHSDEHH
ncbi:hypothetical protein B0I35DRAFT_208012 [Stachybotrys elegans]|uniref:Uncharacterized protein n=1 Tax=Stachybotrys elegans TaxID=80388 RepID=A0A8K0SZQ5_9HYPO|nr:hypothetical protein B0I35DRAFT_208012 [Stachybotrys elegans]